MDPATKEVAKAARNARAALARRNRLIREAREAGMSLRALASATGLTPEGIRHICLPTD